MHPAFFRADGGYFDWIDVDANGRFDPGLDAVDYNANGRADPDETLRFFDALAYSFSVGWDPVMDTDDGVFEVGWDYLYMDLIKNEKRDFGPRAFFSDLDPCFGEPTWCFTSTRPGPEPTWTDRQTTRPPWTRLRPRGWSRSTRPATWAAA